MLECLVGDEECSLHGAVDVEIRSGWQVTPRSLEFVGLKRGETATKHLVLADGMGVEDLELKDVTCSDPERIKVSVADAELEPIAADIAAPTLSRTARYHLSVSYSAKDGVTQQAWIRLIPSRSDIAPYDVPVFCRPTQPLFTVRPKTLVLPATGSNAEIQRDLLIKSTSKTPLDVDVAAAPQWIDHQVTSKEPWRKTIRLRCTVPGTAAREHELVLRINGKRHVCRILLLAKPPPT